MCPRAKGELCAQEYTSNSIPQMRHSPAEDALVCPVSPGKNAQTPLQALSSLPSQAPARAIFFCSSNATDNPQAWPLLFLCLEFPSPRSSGGWSISH